MGKSKDRITVIDDKTYVEKFGREDVDEPIYKDEMKEWQPQNEPVQERVQEPEPYSEPKHEIETEIVVMKLESDFKLEQVRKDFAVYRQVDYGCGFSISEVLIKRGLLPDDADYNKRIKVRIEI